MARIHLHDVRSTIGQFQPERLADPAEVAQRASVALVLAGDEDDLQLCVIKRAERPGDRWSGQMALPGGRASREDADWLEVAIRETAEEVDLRLDRAHHHVGDLSELPLHRHGGDSYGVLSPVVFYVGRELPALRPEPREVAAAHWLALDAMHDSSRFDELTWQLPDGSPMAFPGIRFGQDIIWGLTYRVLRGFFELLDITSLPPLQLPPDWR